MEYVNLNHLKHFYTVAKFRSFSLASGELFVQQPALSKSVKTLEGELGIKLFTRVGRGIELTSEGEYIFARCDEIFSQVDQIIRYARDEDTPLKHSVAIVCSDVIAARIAPVIVEKLSHLYPSTRPILSAGKSSEQVELIKDKKAGIGFFFHLPKLKAGVKVIEEIPLEFKLVISAREFHSLRVRTAFIGSREVDDPAVVKFPTVEKMKQHWPSTQIRFSSNSLISHLEMVKHGLGVSILPNFLVREDIRMGELKTLLDEERFIFNLKVVSAKGKLGEYESAFLRELKSQLS